MKRFPNQAALRGGAFRLETSIRHPTKALCLHWKQILIRKLRITRTNSGGNAKLGTELDVCVLAANCNQTRIISGVMFDHLTERMPKWAKQTAVGSILGVLGYSFKLFHPLAYGFADASTERNSTMFGLRWLETWEF
jgi:hypothetical protein